MLLTTIVFAFAASLVVGYVVICNRMLRTDENWSEHDTPVADQPTSSAVVNGTYARA